MRWYERSNTRSDELHDFGPEHETQEEAVAWMRSVIAGGEEDASIDSKCRYVLGFPELTPVFTLPLDQLGVVVTGSGDGKRRRQRQADTAQAPAVTEPSAAAEPAPPPPPVVEAPPPPPLPPVLRVVPTEPEPDPAPDPAPDYSALTGDAPEDEPAAAPGSPVNIVDSKFGQSILEVCADGQWFYIPFSTRETADKQAAKARDAILQGNQTALTTLVRRMSPGRYQGE